MEVYLDNSATTMCYPEVGELVYHIMCRDYGNPSAMYRKGMEAERYIKEAKETISKLLKVNAKEIIFMCVSSSRFYEFCRCCKSSS